MDEVTHNGNLDFPYYQSDTSDFKNKFIEQWLLSMAVDFNHGPEDHRSKDCDSMNSILGSFEANTPSTSLLNFWNIDNSDGRKKKNSKLQFLNAFRSIFMKKREDSDSDDTSGLLSISQIVNNNNIRFDKTKQGKETKRQIELDIDEDSSIPRRQLNTLGNKLKVKTPRLGIGTIKALDQFNRGFSEIMPYKINYLDHEEVIGNSETNKIKKIEINKKIKDETSRIESRISIIIDHNLMKGDGWNTKLKEKPSSKFVKPCQEGTEKKVTTIKPSPVIHVDSYVNKIEKIQNYFSSRSTKVELNKSKSVINKPTKIRISSSRMIGNAAFYSLTKELTEVPYLREHERLQWQGRNRELWYRINALYSKYNRYNDPVQFKENEPILSNAFSSKLKPTNKIKTKQSESLIVKNKYKSEKNNRRNKCVPFGKTDAARHVKLEELFVSEHTENSRKSVDLSKEEKKINSNDNTNTTWHGALEQVRELMKKSSEDVTRARMARIGQRSQSRVNLTYSSSDWEDVSSRSGSILTPSKTSFTRAKPLPNMTYASKFKHQYQRY